MPSRSKPKIAQNGAQTGPNSNLGTILPKYVQKRGEDWYVRRYFPAGEKNGRIQYTQIVRKVDPPTPERAEEMSRAIEAAYLKATTSEPSSNVKGLVTEYVAAKKRTVEPRTHAYYKWLLRYLAGAFGQLTANDVSPREVQNFYRQLLDEGTSPTMVRKIHIFLSMAFKQAVRWEVISRNPTEGVLLPKAVAPEVEIMTEAQAKAFMKVAMDKAPVLAFALDSWCRPGEYLALEWSKIKDRTVRIERSVTFPSGGGYEFKSPKTKAGKRTILISPQMTELLSSLSHNGKLVFPSRKGTPMTPNNLGRRVMTDICDKAKIPHFSLYSLRHTGISIALAHGADIKSVSERAGHANIQITLDIYAHVMPRMREKTVEIFSNAIY